jgi:hypothetical protein
MVVEDLADCAVEAAIEFEGATSAANEFFPVLGSTRKYAK